MNPQIKKLEEEIKNLNQELLAKQDQLEEFEAQIIMKMKDEELLKLLE